jgi:hypothetical protein
MSRRKEELSDKQYNNADNKWGFQSRHTSQVVRTQRNFWPAGKVILCERNAEDKAAYSEEKACSESQIGRGSSDDIERAGSIHAASIRSGDLSPNMKENHSPDR